ncbi:MAG: HAD-IIA family hydrolase [Saprospiraceae bacterium]|nr:HAD-IIA family hydrolase [Saprospiraceae bacterium]
MQNVKFSELLHRYKVFFFDSYGVIKNYKGIIDGVPQLFEQLHRNNIPYYLLTNDASRSPAEMAEKFHQTGLNWITEEVIITSGMMAKEYLKYKVPQGKVAYLGTLGSAYYVESLGLEAIHLNDLQRQDFDDIKAFLFLDDEGFDWSNSINLTINLLRKRNIPVVVANSDKIYPVSKEQVAVAIGSLANLVESIVQKRFIKFGKPDSQMFMYAYEKLLEKQVVSKSEILMIGDTLHTDILGGNKFGLDTALVLSGNTLLEQLEHSVNNTGIIPTYVCESVSMLD